jgi:hypothetical protein
MTATRSVDETAAW